MQRATREFIRARQPHTAFEIRTWRVESRPQVGGLDPQDQVHAYVREHAQARAVIGWRHGAPQEGQTWFEPWWWVTEDGQTLIDLGAPTSRAVALVDQALAVYRGQDLRANQLIRPPDLVWQPQGWHWATGEPIACLDRAHLTRRRQTMVTLAHG